MTLSLRPGAAFAYTLAVPAPTPTRLPVASALTTVVSADVHTSPIPDTKAPLLSRTVAASGKRSPITTAAPRGSICTDAGICTAQAPPFSCATRKPVTGSPTTYVSTIRASRVSTRPLPSTSPLTVVNGGESGRPTALVTIASASTLVTVVLPSRSPTKPVETHSSADVAAPMGRRLAKVPARVSSWRLTRRVSVAPAAPTTAKMALMSTGCPVAPAGSARAKRRLPDAESALTTAVPMVPALTPR